MSAAVTGPVVAVLAQAPPGAERGEEFGKTSPIALVVILLLGLATVLLIRSMGKHLRKVPASFDEESTETGADDDASSEGPERPQQPAAPDGAQRDGGPPDRS